MKKKLSFLFILLLALLSCQDKKYSSYKVYPLPVKQNLKPGDKSFLTLKVEIPKDSHIYGNPKGPGTGKPTTLNIKKNDHFLIQEPKFLPAEKFYGFGEKKFTWVYHHETKIFLPFKVKEKAPLGQNYLDIEYQSLLCTNSTCLPQNFNIRYPIEINSLTNDQKGLQPFLKEFNLSKASKEILNETEKISSAQNLNSTWLDKITQENFKPIFLQSSKITNLLQAILLGIIAGLILNFMPCVLPVASLKIMDFVKHANKDRKELFILGAIFSSGIIVSFLFLAILASFFGYNWGNLFQNNIFLIIMASLIFVLALSMFDLYSLNVPFLQSLGNIEQKNYYLDTFFKGLLATLLATPCSGPFLGGTLAWALTQPPLIIFIIFISIGIGMASPYLLISLNPRFMKIIPKPGPWMKTFEHLMGFFLIFTVLYLISLLPSFLFLPIITFFSFLGLGFWQYGIWGSLHQPKKKRLLAILSLIVIIIGGYFLSFKYLYSHSETKNFFNYEKFSLEKIYQNKKNNQISIVKFTADWCPNCKAVEKISLETKAIKEKIKNHNLILLKADLTRKSSEADTFLELLGSRSIPFLAIIPPQKFSTPICLRDFYSEKDILRAIEMALPSP